MLLRNLLMLLRAFHWQILLASIMSLDYVDRQFSSLGVPKHALGDSHQYLFDRNTASSTTWEQCRAVTTAVKNHHPYHHPREDVYCWIRASSPLERHNERFCHPSGRSADASFPGSWSPLEDFPPSNMDNRFHIFLETTIYHISYERYRYLLY